jgi:hypothetical protein
MEALPEKIVLLDGALQKKREFIRTDAASVVDGLKNERDYDELIERHVDALAALLRNAEQIQRDSTLRVLGRQIQRTDMLLVEVEDTKHQEFRRLVILENKLLRNAEAKRLVLAQILDYADQLQNEIRLDQIDDEAWLDENRDALEDACRAGDYLLVIAGDRIHPNVARRLEAWAVSANPTQSFSVCAVSMAVYREDASGELLLVPNLVGVVREAQRKLEVRVTVKNAQGDDVTASAEIADIEARDVAKRRWARNAQSEESFLKSWGQEHGATELAACRQILAEIESFRIPRLEQSNLESGRPIFILRDTVLGTVKVLHVALQAAIRDTLDKNRQWAENGRAAKAREEFRAALTTMPGYWRGKGGHVYVPATSMVKRLNDLRDALEKLAAALAAG